MKDALVALVRQSILTVLDEANPRTPGLAWDFNDDEQRVDFADRVAAFLPSAPVSETAATPKDDYLEAVRQNVRLRKALEQCVNVTKVWHGEDAFDLYFNHSPEMKLIRDVLGKMPEVT